MRFERIRQLPDGRYVERDASGRLYFRNADGTTIEELARGSDRYVMLGLRVDHDDRALATVEDPTTASDPYVLVWVGSRGQYMPRAQSNLDKYGAEEPTAEQAATGGYLPPVSEPRPTVTIGNESRAPAPSITKAETATGVPKPAPAPDPVPMPAPTIWQRILAWLRGLFVRGD